MFITVRRVILLGVSLVLVCLSFATLISWDRLRVRLRGSVLRNVTQFLDGNAQMRATGMPLRSSISHSLEEQLANLSISPRPGDLPHTSTTTGTSTAKHILINSKYKFAIADGLLGGCKEEVPPCILHSDRAAINFADAVVWNPRWMEPIGAPPNTKRKGQRWLFNFFFEAAVYDYEEVALETTEKLAHNIDWTMTYGADSDFFQPYNQLAKRDTILPYSDENMATNKPILLVAFISNCMGVRISMFKSIREALPMEERHRVKMYGACEEGGDVNPCPDRRDEACMDHIVGSAKFYFAAENSRCTGYITEKFFRGYKHGAVPLAAGGLGRQDYEALAPGSSFLHVDDFPSIGLLVQRLLELDRDDEAYSQMFHWRGTHVFHDTNARYVQSICELCAELHVDEKLQRQRRTFKDLSEWWYDGRCQQQ